MNREVYNGAIDTQHENTLVSPGTQENYGAITFLPLTICVLCVYVPSRGASPLDPSSPHQPKAADPNLVDAELGGGGGGRRLL